MSGKKKVYSYDPATLAFIGESVAYKDPKEEGEKWLIPAHATTKKPPKPGENETPVFNKANNEWELVEDYAVEEAPEDVDPYGEQEMARKVREQRTRKLRRTDYTQLPDAPLTDAEKESYKEYRAALRDVPQQDGFPDNINWPKLEDFTNV